MVMADNPKWGTPEFNEAMRKHDKKADPKREKQDLPYTKSRNPANPPKKAEKKPPPPKKDSGGKGGKKK